MEKIYRLLAEGRGGHERAPLEKFQLHFSLLRQHDATRDPFNFDIIFCYLSTHIIYFGRLQLDLSNFIPEFYAVNF